MSTRSASVLFAAFGAFATAAPAQVIFTENFEGGMLGAYTETDGAGTATATLWHGESLCTIGTPMPASLGTNAASYNQGDIGLYTYNTGAANSGAIQSPVGAFVPSPGSVRTLAFDYMKETEGGGTATFDQCFVESRTGAGAYATDLQISGNSVCTRTAVTATLSAPGPSIQHQFRFNSGDGVLNDFQGWTVDNVVLTSSLPGPDPNYCVDPTAAPFASILGAPGTVAVFGPGVDDTTSAATALPPMMSFYGAAKATFQINNNGWVAFNQALAGGFFTNAAIPTAAAPNDMIAPFWDDLHTGPLAGGLGMVAYQVTPAGNLVVEWNSMEKFPANLSGENVTFQMELFKDPGHKIQFRYDPVTFSSGAIVWDATIGVENSTGAKGTDATGLGTANAGFPATSLELNRHTSGTVSSAPTGCGGLTLASGGSPNIGDTFILGLGGATGISAIALGVAPAAIPLCPGCTLSLVPIIVIPGTTLSAAVPCNPILVGASILFQGGDIDLMLPCPIRVSNTLTATIG